MGIRKRKVIKMFKRKPDKISNFRKGSHKKKQGASASSAMRAMQGQQGDKLKICFTCGQPCYMKKDYPNEGQARKLDDSYLCFTCGQCGH